MNLNYHFEHFLTDGYAMLCIADLSGRFVKLSTAWADALGFSLSQLEGSYFMDLVHPDDVAATEEALGQLRFDQRIEKFVNRYRCSNGEYRYLEWHSVREHEYIYATARDVTDTVIREEEWRKASALLDTINSIQQSFIANANLAQTFDRLLAALLQASDSEYGFIGEKLEDEQGQPYLKTYAITNISWNEETRHFYEQDAPRGMVFGNLNTLFGKVLTTQQPVIANAPAVDPRRGGLPQGHPPLTKFLGLPLFVRGQMVGMAGVANRPGGYSEEIIRRLSPLLSTIGQLLDAQRREQEAQRIQQQLDQTREILARTNEMAHIGGWEYDLRTSQTFWTDMIYANHGVPKSYQPAFPQLLGLFAPWSRPVLTNVFEHALATGEPYDVELQIVRADTGELRWVRAIGMPVFENGACVKVYGTMQDIHERKIDELALEESRRHFASIVTAIPDLIFRLDAIGTILSCHASQPERLLMPETEFLGKTVTEVMPPDLAAQMMEKLAEVLATRQIGIIEYQLHLPSGRRSFEEARMVPAGPGEVMCLVRDIAQRKEREAQLQRQAEELEELNAALRAQKQAVENALESLEKAQRQMVQSEKMASLGQLTAGLAHEINNPINFIYGGIQGLEALVEDLRPIVKWSQRLQQASCYEDCKSMIGQFQEWIRQEGIEHDFREIQTLFGDVRVGIQRVVGIVASLRAFSRGDNERMAMDDIHQNIENTLLILQNKHRGRIEIRRHFDAGMAPIACYPGQLGQMFMNLLDNAMDAIPGEGWIEIDTQYAPGQIEIRISDSGEGIPETVLHRIFEPFFTTKEVGKGTGLGLAIVHGIVERHHGTISAEKGPNGQGTVFRILLPVRPLPVSF
jgi:PAS domain S-box-containing protein